MYLFVKKNWALLFVTLVFCIIALFPVTVFADNDSNTIKSIEFTPAKPYEYIENDRGSFWTDADNKKYFRYELYYPGMYGQNGDTLTIEFSDGTKKDYVCSVDVDKEEVFFVNGNERISDWDIEWKDDQSKNHWTVGADNYFTVSYKGCSCTVPVKIVKSPVKSLSFIPAVPYSYKENDPAHSEWIKDEDGDRGYYLVYDVPQFADGDKLIVETSDGTKEYIYQYGCFICGGDEINDGIRYEVDQYENPWTVGSDNYFIIRYRGTACKVQVTIIGDGKDDPVVHTHTLERFEAKAATSTEEGNTEYWKCTGCGKYFSDAAGTIEINEGSWVIPPLDDKQDNTMSASAKTVNIKYTKLKKKTQTIQAAKVFTIKSAKGKVSYKLTKKDKKAKAKITVSSDGKVTIKKGLKKGKYTIKVKVTAAGDENYKATSETLKVTIKIK